MKLLKSNNIKEREIVQTNAMENIEDEKQKKNKKKKKRKTNEIDI